MGHTKSILLWGFLAAAGSVPLSAHALAPLQDGLLIQGPGPEVFVIENGRRRWVLNEEIFASLEFDWGKIQPVSQEELERIPAGPPLEKKGVYPEGVLLRASKGKGGDGERVYRLRGGKKHWIQTEKDFENLRLLWETVFDVSPGRLKAFRDGPVVRQTEFVTPPTSVFTVAPTLVENTAATFRFTGRTGKPHKPPLTFQTFVEGLDREWVTARKGERTVKLPVQSRRYTFFLRAADEAGNSEPVPQAASFEVRLSPFFGRVVILSAQTRLSDPQQEYVRLQGKSAEPVVLGGWSIGSEKLNTRYSIPPAAEIPSDPAGELVSDVVLPENGTVFVTTGRTPLTAGFRVNTCIGYLRSGSAFTPTLPNLCPAIRSEETKSLSSYCKKVIDKLGQCAAPNLQDFLLDNECRAFLSQRINYATCVNNGRSFHDFFWNEWRVYLGLTHEIWTERDDTIILRDREGLVVNRSQ